MRKKVIYTYDKFPQLQFESILYEKDDIELFEKVNQVNVLSVEYLEN